MNAPRSLGSLIGLMLIASVLLGCGLFDRLARPSASAPVASAGASVEAFATDLGKVYGLAFDGDGNLLATGTQGSKSVVWKLDSRGAKSIVAEISDPPDVLAALGISNHSQYLANLAVDGQGNIWITSLHHGACFVVSQDGQVTKVYLNSAMSISIREDTHFYPQGVAWDGKARKLYIITSGPQSAFAPGTDVYHLRTLSGNPDQDVREIKDTGNHAVKVMDNDGILLKEPGNGLLANNSAVYFIGQKALYAVSADGKLKMFGEEAKDMTLWGGAADDRGNIYLAANGKDYDPTSSPQAKGVIFKLDSQGKANVFLKDTTQPLGLAVRGGYLYIADRATGNILKVKVEQ